MAQEKREEFDRQTLRLLVGLAAVLIPPAVIIVSGSWPSSISASYHTRARDVFVGSLFAIGTLLLAYNGKPSAIAEHSLALDLRRLHLEHLVGAATKLVQALTESRVSKLGGLAMLCVALAPTSCDSGPADAAAATPPATSCPTSAVSDFHYAAAAVVFLILLYFCVGPFRWSASKKIADLATSTASEQEQAEKRTKWEARKRWYRRSGAVILFAIVSMGLAKLALSGETIRAWHLYLLLETVALWAFGLAWLVASRISILGRSPFATRDEALELWPR